MTVDAGVLWQATERKIFSETNSDILKKNIPELFKRSKTNGLDFLKELGQ